MHQIYDNNNNIDNLKTSISTTPDNSTNNTLSTITKGKNDVNNSDYLNSMCNRFKNYDISRTSFSQRSLAF